MWEIIGFEKSLFYILNLKNVQLPVVWLMPGVSKCACLPVCLYRMELMKPLWVR